ncbi:MAG: hypothetical protein HY467_03745 [Betaproteobacteria bacterium]|nr:hypothetical protein [Betaproteobacteria bacterium]
MKLLVALIVLLVPALASGQIGRSPQPRPAPKMERENIDRTKQPRKERFRKPRKPPRQRHGEERDFERR